MYLQNPRSSRTDHIRCENKECGSFDFELGRSENFIRDSIEYQRVQGFCSFCGLEHWVVKATAIIKN